MVCLKATPEEMEKLMKLPIKKADFVDEDLDNMRTAIAFGPLGREDGERLFGHLKLA